MQQPQVFQVSIKPTTEVLQYLANLKSTPAQSEIIVSLTEEEYAAMPGADDIRKHIVADYVIYDITRQHDTNGLTENLKELLKEYNEENPAATFSEVVDLEHLTPVQTRKALGAIARCTNEDDIKPWERSTSVTEAIADEELTPGEIFRH